MSPEPTDEDEIQQHNEEGIVPQNILSSSIADSMASMTDETDAAMEKIRRILTEIFIRFKKFDRMRLQSNGWWVRFAIDHIFDIFDDNSSTESTFFEVKQLLYIPRGNNDDSFEFSERDCRLISSLKDCLEVYMVLDGEIPEEGTDLSKKYWSAISTCANLRKLYLCRLNRGPDLFLNEDMGNCLKLLKISEFHTYSNNERDSSAEWLVESFKDNFKLRKLFICPFITHIVEQLSTPSVLKMVERLHSVEIAVCTYSYTEFQQGVLGQNIYKIMRALPESGYVNVEHFIIIPETVEEVDQEEIGALSFWIRISDQTRKRIRLYARTRNFNLPDGIQAIAIPRERIDSLQQHFTGIQIEHKTNRAILKFNNAKVSFYFTLLAWKKYLSPEYVSRSKEHTG
jgi:hypothetical protein